MICILDIQYTDNGEECKNECQKDGESYNWCYKVSGSWDYCTPLLKTGKQEQDP